MTDAASALAWALYWVHSLPEVEAKLRSELAEAGVTASPAQIAKTPVDIMGFTFEAGMALIPCIHLVHRREELYPESERFRPERFLERQFSPYEFFPFGGGARMCLGTGLANLEMRLILAVMLMHFHLDLPNPRRLKPRRRGLIMAVPDGLAFRVVRGIRVESDGRSVSAIPR